MPFSSLFSALADWVFPPVCETCSALVAAGRPGPVCSDCAARVRPVEAPHCERCGRTAAAGSPCVFCASEHFHFDGAAACAYYEGTMRELLHAFKFSGRRALAPFFVSQLGALYSERMAGRFDEIVPVPLDAKKERKRGFNQSETLAQGLACQARLPLFRRLERVGGAEQARLTKSERRSNVKGLFRLRSAEGLTNRRVLLVDDVLTTGSTASECARVLKDGGAAAVTALACARADA